MQCREVSAGRVMKQTAAFITCCTGFRASPLNGAVIQLGLCLRERTESRRVHPSVPQRMPHGESRVDSTAALISSGIAQLSERNNIRASINEKASGSCVTSGSCRKISAQHPLAEFATCICPGNLAFLLRQYW